MTAPAELCSLDAIERYLDERSTPDEERRLTSHLDRCPTCRAALSGAAADERSWSDAVVFLADDELDDAVEASRPGGATIDLFEGRVPEETALVLARLAPSDDPRYLGRLGSYEIAGVVGRGGFGIVLKAFDRALNRFVAIKVLAPHLAASGSARRRFAREAQAAAAVVHENVVAIHGVAEREGLPYLVMEYVRGESLQRRLDRQGPCGATEILRVGRQVAEGLAAAHAQGLVHRDVKPANILLEEGVERLKLTDFGLARAADDASLTRTGSVSGTPQYMSPEQARGESIDVRSDLFSLGSVLYAMAAGRPPFRAETSLAVLRRIADDPARPVREINADIPSWLAGMIGRLHAKESGERFESADAFARLCGDCLAHLQEPTKVPLPEEARRLAAPEPRSRRPSAVWKFVGGGALLVASIVALVAAYSAATSGDDGPPPVVPATSSPSASLSEEFGWGDDEAAELDRLRQDAERLEAESERLFEAP